MMVTKLSKIFITQQYFFMSKITEYTVLEFIIKGPFFGTKKYVLYISLKEKLDFYEFNWTQIFISLKGEQH